MNRNVGYIETKKGGRFAVETQVVYDFSYLEYTQIVLPYNGIGELINCSYNNLTELYIPDGFQYAFCWNNPNLETIRIPDSLKLLCCDLNLIEKNYEQWMHANFHVTNGTDATPYEKLLNFEAARIMANELFRRIGSEMRL